MLHTKANSDWSIRSGDKDIDCQMSSRCLVTDNILSLFLTVSWVGLQCVIVAFPDFTHLFIYLHDIEDIFACDIVNKVELRFSHQRHAPYKIQFQLAL